MVEAEGIPRHYLDAPPGDLPLNVDSRAFPSAQLRPMNRVSGLGRKTQGARENRMSARDRTPPKRICRHAKRLDVCCPWPVPGLYSVSTSSQNPTFRTCGPDSTQPQTMRRSGLNMVTDKSRSWPVQGLNTDMFADGSRTRIVLGQGQAAVMVADWTSLRTVGRTSQGVFQPFHETCVGMCMDDSRAALWSVDWMQTWTLRARQVNCFADFSGNYPDAFRLLLLPLCGRLPVLC